MRNWKNIRKKGFDWKYSLGDFFRGKYLRENSSPFEPETLRRAKGFRYVLENTPLTLSDDQMFFGGMETFYVNELPEGETDKDYENNITFRKFDPVRWTVYRFFHFLFIRCR